MSKEHWENVFAVKSPQEVSWTQEGEPFSLGLIRTLNISKSTPIIDIGGGDSDLVDYLLKDGFIDITVLDISGAALSKAKERLEDKAAKVKWIESNITDFVPDRTFGLWHDRAAFHFLTEEAQIKKYSEIVSKNVTGEMIIGTFSKTGPLKCSGLPISQYDESTLAAVFEPSFELKSAINHIHTTPFGTTQDFIFCLLGSTAQRP